MRFYTATRTLLNSPNYKYFSSIDELNSYWNIDSTIDDYDCGYCFPYTEHIFMTLGTEN